MIATSHFVRSITASIVTSSILIASSANGAVGRTPAEVGVSASGSASYVIPIAVPPGINGLAPELALTYGHRQGEGVAGVGWGISGLSAISRCGKTPAQNETYGSVLLQQDDRFCLDGNQLRLVSGAYGVAGSTYRTEIDLMARITAYGTAGNGPAWFKVEAKDGLIYEYGSTADSRIESLALGFTTTARTWALSKISDRSGNEIRYVYTEDGAPLGDYRINRIDYRLNPSAGVVAGYFVGFTYGTQPLADVDVGYGADGTIEDTKQLNKIYVVGPLRYREYNLSYEQPLASTNRNRIQSIQECSGVYFVPPYDCRTATQFAYSDGTPGLDAEVLSGTTLAAGVKPMSLDINGDGRTDLVYASQATSGFWVYRLADTSGGYAPAVTTTIASTGHDRAIGFDYNSDGIDDILVPYSGSTWWAIQGLAGGGLQAPINSGTTNDSVDAMSADVDGDGREDLVYRVQSQGIFVRYRETSGGFSAVSTQIMNDLLRPKLRVDYKSSRRYQFDVNGDGAEDILIFTGKARVPSKIWVWTYQNGTFNNHYVTDVTANEKPLPLDMNGDGYSDLVTKGNYPNNMGYRIATGKVLGPTVTIPSTADLDIATAVRLDWDSDGYDDILAPNSVTSTWYLIRSEGRSFATPINTQIPTSAPSTSFWADVDGNGLEDIVYVKSNGDVASRKHAGVKPDHLMTVTDGNGNLTSFEYAPLTDSNVYQRYSTALFPNQDYQQPDYVVKSVERSSGTGSTYTLDYTYAGAQRNIAGRGLNGFANRTAIDSRTGNKVVETYELDFPYRTRLSRSELRLADNTLVQSTDFTWQSLIGGTGNEIYHFPYLSQSVRKNYEGQGIYNGAQVNEITETNSVDNYGTVIDTVTVTEEKTTANGAQPGATYTERTLLSSVNNNFATWCLGKPDRVEQINFHSEALGAQVTRTRDLAWDVTTNCRLNSSIIEPDSVHAGNSIYQVTVASGYDAFGNVNSSTVTGKNMSPRVTLTDWGSTGQYPAARTNPLSQTTTYEWDFDFGKRNSSTDPNGITESRYYDFFGRLLKDVQSDGSYVDYTLSDCSAGNNFCGTYLDRTKTKIHASSKSSTGIEIRFDDTFLDILDRPIQSDRQALNGGTVTRRIEFDTVGRISKRYMPTFATTPSDFVAIDFDFRNRPVDISRPVDSNNPAIQHTSINYEGLSVRVVDAENNEATKVFDALGRVYRSKDHNGYYQEFERDPFGSLGRTTDSLSNLLNEFDYEYGISALQVSTYDMDMGSWIYTPNALSEVIAHSDAKGQIFSATFDKLGRQLTRVEPEGTTTWVWGATAANHNIGRLQSVSGPGHSQSYLYDSLGRLSKHTTTSDASYDIDYGYDATTGFLSSVQYPVSDGSFRLKVLREYQYGLLGKVKRSDGAQNVYWQAMAEDAFGNIVDEDFGEGANSVTTISGYDPITGRLDFLQSGKGGGTGLQDFEYSWDKVGNLIRRHDINRNLEEKFYYDDVNRLDYSELNLATNLDLSYDSMGNILVKSDVTPSTWTYHSIKKHAVVTAGPSTYGYDANGNMTTRNGNSITWTSFNYPSAIVDGTRTYQYAYDADRQRWKQVYDNGIESESTYYVGDIFEKNVNDDTGNTTYRHFIYAREGAVAIHSRPVGGAAYDRFLLRNHQGSVAALIDGSGASKVYENFAAFGERRDASDWVGSPSSADKAEIAGTTDRGYTDHLGLEESSLIHMRGRVMDAKIGRFLSPDPYVTDPGNPQNFNRYSYVLNNPLRFTDPSGFDLCFGDIFSCGAAVIGTIFRFFGKRRHRAAPPPPPPDWCAEGGPQGCYGDSVAIYATFGDDDPELPNEKQGDEPTDYDEELERIQIEIAIFGKSLETDAEAAERCLEEKTEECVDENNEKIKEQSKDIGERQRNCQRNNKSGNGSGGKRAAAMAVCTVPGSIFDYLKQRSIEKELENCKLLAQMNCNPEWRNQVDIENAPGPRED